MNKSSTALILAIAATSAIAPVLAQAPAGGKKLYCWNENGKRVCGDALPASAVDSARTEISAKSGLATGRVDRALTDSERAAAKRQAVLDEQAAQAVAAQRLRELAMVESYATEADLRRAFGERIALLDDTIKATQLSIGSLRMSLVSLLRQAGEAELARQPVQAGLSKSIRSQHDELLRQQNLLVQHRQNRSVVDADLARALERYRAVKSSASAPTQG